MFGLSLKISAHLSQFFASFLKFSSYGSSSSNSSESQEYLKSGNSFSAPLNTCPNNRMSPGDCRRTFLCWTFTATSYPVALITALCAWPREALPRGMGSNSENSSSSSFPNSSRMTTLTSSKVVRGASFISGAK